MIFSMLIAVLLINQKKTKRTDPLGSKLENKLIFSIKEKIQCDFSSNGHRTDYKMSH